MKILVINSGSSSLKYQLLQMPDELVICSGIVERIGQKEGKVSYESVMCKKEEILSIPTHKEGLDEVVNLITDSKIGVIKSKEEINAVGHRVVHGGSNFADTAIIDEVVKENIRSLFSLAPLHNPPNLLGIEVTEELFPNAAQIAVFDTAFFQSLPEYAYTYAIPKHLALDNGIRVYGFHGTSHKFVSEKALEYLNLKDSKLITIHLGNGCSITALENGRPIDHSLGFGPSNGLVMGTRSGDVDQSIIFYLIDKLGYSSKEVNDIIQKKSGMLGLTGNSDLRDIQKRAEEGDRDCQLALDISTYRIKKFIGAYVAALNGIDALVFTAGIGENSDVIRTLVCDNMDYFGIELDPVKNATRSKKLREIQKDTALVKLIVIPTNEELEIAKQTYQIINS